MQPPTRAKKSKSGSKRSHEEYVEEEDDAEFEAYMAKVEGFAARDSECDSLCSSEDTDQSSTEEECSDEANHSESSDEAKMPRKAPGTHVVYSNSFFTFTDNPAFPDVKVRVLERWCTKDDMGVSAKSKTVVPAHFGEERSECQRSMWVLKAWMLWKSTTNDFCNLKPRRRRLFAKETLDLRN